uniref:Tyr recombinase domain-containing protein n=1 Tax=Xenopus tropicalis TaxID=8364 RepID=A0A803JTY8_XENTR
MGRGKSTRFNCCIYSWKRKHYGRFSLPSSLRLHRMGAESRCLRFCHSKMGNSSHRSNGNPTKLKSDTFLFKGSIPTSRGSGCPSSGLGGGTLLHLSTPSNDIPSASQDNEVRSQRDSYPTRLATSTLVPPSQETDVSTTSSSQKQAGLACAGTSGPSFSSSSQSQGMEVERRGLVNLGVSTRVVSTLMKARKVTTSSQYYKIWDRFVCRAQRSKYDPFQPSTNDILEFLQSGLDRGLSWSSLRVQVSALSAVLNIKWAEDPLVVRFLAAAKRIHPPFKNRAPPWDLPLVLRALSRKPFSPMENISLWHLTLKTALLVAVTSARRISELRALSCEPPFTVFYPEKVVLRTMPDFLPKVVSSFHLNEPINLPSFHPESSTSNEELFRNLDVRDCLETYIIRTQPIREAKNLFVVPAGSYKGQAATTRTIGRWIVIAIVTAYKEQGSPMPEGVRAHSTRGMATSWAAAAQAAPESICKAATWSSSNTFLRHYRLDVLSYNESLFGQKVLQAASS